MTSVAKRVLWKTALLRQTRRDRVPFVGVKTKHRRTKDDAPIQTIEFGAGRIGVSANMIVVFGPQSRTTLAPTTAQSGSEVDAEGREDDRIVMRAGEAKIWMGVLQPLAPKLAAILEEAIRLSSRLADGSRTGAGVFDGT